MVYERIFKTALGYFRLRATSRGLYSLEFPIRAKRKPGAQKAPAAIDRVLRKTALRIDSVLRRRRINFKDCPIDWTGVSPFSRRVLGKLREIPTGRVTSYQGLAQRVGVPKGARSVGQALGSNRLPIILPCHRVILKTGDLGGFSRGRRVKKLLLKLEGAWVDKNLGKKARFQGYFNGLLRSDRILSVRPGRT